MNNDYMNDEMEIDLIELLKAILCSIKFLFIITLISGATIFCISQFILQKSYISSTDITIMPAEQSLDYTSYLKSSKVLNKVSENVDIDPANLANSIIITRDSVNSFNYNITVTTNNPKLSYIIVKNIVEEFKSTMMEELNLSDISIVNEAQINRIPVSPNIKKNTLIGSFIGLLGGIGIVVFRFLFNKHFINDKEVEMFLGVDVLAEIPMEK